MVWRQNGELPEQVACSCQETCVSLSSQQEGSFSSKTAWEGWGAGIFSLFWRQQCLGFAEAGFLLFECLQGTVSAFHLNNQCLHLELWYLFPLSVEKTLTSYPAVGGWRVCHSLSGQGGRDYLWVGWWWWGTGELSFREPSWIRCLAAGPPWLLRTGQSYMMKMHSHLGNQLTGKAVTWQSP